MRFLSRSNFLVLIILVFSTVAIAQTKKERKAKLTNLSTGMYNSTESKEAMKYYELGVNAARENDFKGAIKHYKKSLKSDPKFVEAYDNIGVCYRRLGDLKNAIANYNKSIELYPQGTMAHMNLGVIYGIQKEWDRAIAEYKLVQEIDPEDPEGYYGTVNAYMNKGQFKDAIVDATKTLEIYEATESPYVHACQ